MHSSWCRDVVHKKSAFQLNVDTVRVKWSPSLAVIKFQSKFVDKISSLLDFKCRWLVQGSARQNSRINKSGLIFGAVARQEIEEMAGVSCECNWLIRSATTHPNKNWTNRVDFRWNHFQLHSYGYLAALSIFCFEALFLGMLKFCQISS